MSKKVAMKALVIMFGVVANSLSAAPTAVGQETVASNKLNQDLYFDLDFPGGTLEQYLKVIHKAHPGANVFLSEESKTARIPAIKLDSVTLGATIKLVQGDTHTATGDPVSVWWIPVDIAGRIEKAYRMGVHSAAQQIGTGRTNVWSLRDLVDGGMKMDDVLGAVNAALKTIDSPAEIRLHEPTSLLIVRGTEEQLELVEQVGLAMQKDIQDRTEREEWMESQIDDIQGDLVKAEAKNRVAQKRLEIASEQVKSYEIAFAKRRAGMDDKGLANSNEVLRDLELEMIQAEGELEIRQDKVVRLHRRMNRLRGGGSE